MIFMEKFRGEKTIKKLYGKYELQLLKKKEKKGVN